ncbi:hypothetical protein Ocin01_17619 [Orchesella cincta]|uniref:Uncharacterized protein n=1 Tax=Orchesella cincta TaxID=48709 RepID=A0A1D2M7W3_ORCCI|nr:hypothetical protein Ocin01_17619 [Orchesella cincta]
MLGFADFNELSVNIPRLLADEWEHLNIIQPLTDCIQRMDTLKAKMNLELQAFLTKCGAHIRPRQ